MYNIETALEDELGKNADDLELGDLGVIISPPELRGDIVVKVLFAVVNLSNPKQSPWTGHCNVMVRKLSIGESIILTV